MEKQQSMPALKDTEPSAKRLRVLAPQESKDRGKTCEVNV